jgi:hypothetical protein
MGISPEWNGARPILVVVGPHHAPEEAGDSNSIEIDSSHDMG